MSICEIFAALSASGYVLFTDIRLAMRYVVIA